MDKQCNHKWIDMEDGSLDTFCVRCRKKGMQSVMVMPVECESIVPNAIPIMRETMSVHTPVGMMEVDKENLVKEFQKDMRIGMQNNIL